MSMRREMVDPRSLDSVGEDEYLRRGNMVFLECAIGHVVRDLGVLAAASILEDEARILREIEGEVE